MGSDKRDHRITARFAPLALGATAHRPIGPSATRFETGMPTFPLIALLVGLAALFGYINHRTLRLPDSIGVLTIAIAVSGLLLVISRQIPQLGLQEMAVATLRQADLPKAFLKGALAFLLFAGAFHVDLGALWTRKWTVLALATGGVLIATALFGLGMFGIFAWIGIDMPLAWCLVLGAIVAPTDPVAVLGIVKRVELDPALQATIAGESLFNDGVGVVAFTLLLAVAQETSTISVSGALASFLLEALGGALLGLATGYIAFVAMRSIDKYDVELTISLALVMLTYSTAELLGISGPIAVTVAGLLIGTHATRLAMSDTTRHNVEIFWSLIDQVLNALLFMLIGFAVLAVELSLLSLAAAAAAVLLAIAVRAISVIIPVTVVTVHLPRNALALATMVWGGLRGGVSIALALTLPATEYRGPLLTACYAIVVFTILVQGTTLEPLLRRLR